ncbi:MAG: DUF1192 domain-containing protein [Asticcacaulis sp.]
MSDEDPSPDFGTGAEAGSALHALMHEDLSIYSVEDLSERLLLLEAEIGRSRAALEKKKSGRSAADSLFSFKGN